jgi:beta-phosphoglucomutase-like phosphatase (HAD superfamily)
MARMRRPEQEIQKAVIQHLEARGVPGLVYFHVPMGGKRSRVEAAIMKGLGVKAGVSDLILLHRGKMHALELKADKGKPTPAQEAFLEAVKAAGGHAVWATGLDEAIYTLQFWGLLRGTTSLGRAA